MGDTLAAIVVDESSVGAQVPDGFLGHSSETVDPSADGLRLTLSAASAALISWE